MLESNDARVLLDCGVKIGRADEYPVIEDADLVGIDAIIISHAHLDHSAYLPHVFSAGYNNPVYSTKPTMELINILVTDYLRISEPENVEKIGLQEMQKHFRLVEFHQEFNVKDLTIKLVPAGHILGSAMIEISDGKQKLIYTGDMNMRVTRLLEPAYTRLLRADTLLMESTYGGDADTFPSEKVIVNQMIGSIKETASSGGKIIIPSFGVGRAQEMLLLLDDYMKSGQIPSMPIYADGMINKAMRIHRHNVIYCREELQKRILLNDDDPFKSKNFIQVGTIAERKKVMGEKEPSIIVTTSGMLTGGPVLKYIERLGADPNNKMIIVGYQAEGTRGRELVNGSKKIKVGPKLVDVNLKVEQYHLSAHSDRQQLISLVGKVEGLGKVILIHGDKTKSNELAEAIKKDHETSVPTLKDEITLG